MVVVGNGLLILALVIISYHMRIETRTVKPASEALRMAEKSTKVVLCSCEDSMTLDAVRIKAGCPNKTLSTVSNLCGTELFRFKSLAAEGDLVVGCTQEAQRFTDIAEDEGLKASISFVNVRETAGWSTDGRIAGPKMAALVAAAAIEPPPPAGVTMESEGVTLIYGRTQAAIDAATLLQDRLDVTVILSDSSDVIPPSRTVFPVRRGRIRLAKGHLGAFEVTIDGFAEPHPSSRAAYAFGAPRDGAVSKPDILIDLTGNPPLFPGDDLRDGYLRADPGDPAAVQRLLFKAADLVGTFDKPRYVTFREELCAHSRSRIVGCRRCLDLCPAGAIEPAGNNVAIDPFACGGCGQCAAACPTGAASYALPAADMLMRRLREMLVAYRAAGGSSAIILFHDGGHGRDLIEATARFSDGLPANVLPLEINEIGQVGLETVAAAFAYGASGVSLLTRSKPRHDPAGPDQTIATADMLLGALGYGSGAVARIATDDPDELAAILRVPAPGRASAKPSSFLPIGGKRDVLKIALRELGRSAPTPIDTVPLPKGAVFGRAVIETSGCTLCLSCVSSCPTGALSDQKDRPALRFDESLCVQCGLCQGTCPEKVISLEPRIDFNAFEAGPIVVKEEEPFCCITCSKPFGVKSTIERVTAKLAEKHWMFTGEQSKRLDLIRMCEDCRIAVATNEAIDPYGAPPRPIVRTTDDYLKEREAAEARENAMLERIKRGDA